MFQILWNFHADDPVYRWNLKHLHLIEGFSRRLSEGGFVEPSAVNRGSCIDIDEIVNYFVVQFVSAERKHVS